MPKKTYDIRQTFDVEYRATEVPGIVVYRTTLSEKGKEEQVNEGICRLQDLPTPDQQIPPMLWGSEVEIGNPRYHGCWRLLTKKDFEEFCKYGYTKPGKEPFEETYPCQKASETPFAEYGNPDMVLVRDFEYGHMLFMADGTPVPLAQHIDYDEWSVHNEYYDLDRAEEILSLREDVHDLRKDEIPYFEANKERNLYLDFIWRPTASDMSIVWDYILEKDWAYPSAKFPQAIRELDFWGIECARLLSFLNTVK